MVVIGYRRTVADEPNRQELLSALTTEHFTLQGARSQTVSESVGRATLYVMSVSSTLIALGFLAQISEVGDTFNVFALTALPTLYVLGLFTYLRLVESAAEDFLYGRAINRIRHYYLELAGEERQLFLLSGYDDARGVLANMGLRPSRWQIFFTTASMVTVINSVVGGSAVAIAIGAITDAPLGVSAAIGVVVAIVSIVALRRHEQRMLVECYRQLDVLFPSPHAP